jgi:Flp pilus assembly protein TadD
MKKSRRISRYERFRLQEASEQRVFTPEQNARREELLRPSGYLGYNHNSLAMHLLERGAYAIAESELRRAIWLNPYEPAFQANLAWCLYRQRREDEAGECLKQAIEQGPDNVQVRQVANLMGVVIKRADLRDDDETRT